ncbi:ImmA/IrrE family metallo-endopeptidase [Leuconostoc suionicum]|uniref:ImmA/IrrE family metallo-endopeptidase n=1 Tax=Leuconostoc suionicum TaxID=1511761 RepID=UPI0019B95EBD|nr:ImmA/IrrE family metallo-endopeptidase [Leuconostoc suionicum]MBC9702884.1 ImmA/IrrE family metallo-endopeptidase [Leuconostoc sp.]MDI6497762.1 ImmA/IrrE family metallo-endopeptidase [Leuconostoc suionicum]MDI6499834.1 ImmA/IrrE family metallo-endopeptidase [Leuconostoc suionicum]MDI6502017.1 ImmA/IrrE family metallo-endopeptidase [Leuconostoc suionicum]MDI6613903.1 ImmA/IrrE family metallo-endopeptidase [Leuconostoc suionicum]
MHRYLDYTSQLEYFEDTIVQYNAERDNNNQILVVEVLGHSCDPDVALPADNTIIINPNFKTKFSLPFRKFHELQHILNGEQHKTYAFSPLAKNDAEISANAYAFKMLADFYFDENTDRYSKLYDFMAYFGIPMSLESTVLKNIQEIY